MTTLAFGSNLSDAFDGTIFQEVVAHDLDELGTVLTPALFLIADILPEIRFDGKRSTIGSQYGNRFYRLCDQIETTEPCLFVASFPEEVQEKFEGVYFDVMEMSLSCMGYKSQYFTADGKLCIVGYSFRSLKWELAKEEPPLRAVALGLSHSQGIPEEFLTSSLPFGINL